MRPFKLGMNKTLRRFTLYELWYILNAPCVFEERNWTNNDEKLSII